MAKQDYSLQRRTGSARGSTSTSGSGRLLETNFNQAHDREIILIESNLKDVINVLSEARDKWYDIGIQIDIPIQTLNGIREKCSASSDALREMLVFCSRQRRIRLMDFVDALTSPAVDLQVCAKNLEALMDKLCPLDKGLVSSTASTGSLAGSGEQRPIVRRLTLEAAKRAKCSHHFEVIVVGDIKVGKTSMLKKFLRTDLEAKDDIIRSTVTPDPIGYRVFKYRDKHVKLKLWDMPGSCSCFNVVNESILEAADGAILLFDVTNEQSFVNLVSDDNNSRQIKRSWMKELMFKAKGDKHPVMILVGNKIDHAERNVSKSVMEQLLPSQSDMPYCEISAKENIGIEEMFESFIVLLMKKASKDERYGVMRNDDHHSHENMASSHDGRRQRMRETYPPSTIIRNQPTPQHHAVEGRVDPNSSPQPRRSTGSSNFCC